MESRIAVISIIVENSDSVECLNRILMNLAFISSAEWGFLIGREG